MAKLSPEEIERVKSWLNDVFIFGGLMPESENKRVGTNLQCYYSYLNSNKWLGSTSASRLAKICTEICKIIQTQPFSNVDYRFKELADNKVPFCPSLKPTANYLKDFIHSTRLPMYGVAWFCQTAGIYWSEAGKSEYEINAFKNTSFGKALALYKCFASQHKKSTKSANTSANTAANKQVTNNSFRSLGPQSKNVRDLIGTPGNKVQLNGPLFCICDILSKKKKQFAYIKPLNKNANSGNTNRVFVGDPSAYGSTVIYFDDIASADHVLGEILRKYSSDIKTDPKNLKVVKVRVDKNGYFAVGTEFPPISGNTFIKAVELNEELTEDVKLDENVIDIANLSSMSIIPTTKPNGDKLTEDERTEVYLEAYNRYDI